MSLCKSSHHPNWRKQEFSIQLDNQDACQPLVNRKESHPMSETEANCKSISVPLYTACVDNRTLIWRYSFLSEIHFLHTLIWSFKLKPCAKGQRCEQRALKARSNESSSAKPWQTVRVISAGFTRIGGKGNAGTPLLLDTNGFIKCQEYGERHQGSFQKSDFVNIPSLCIYPWWILASLFPVILHLLCVTLHMYSRMGRSCKFNLRRIQIVTARLSSGKNGISQAWQYITGRVLSPCAILQTWKLPWGKPSGLHQTNEQKNHFLKKILIKGLARKVLTVSCSSFLHPCLEGTQDVVAIWLSNACQRAQS